MIPETGNYSECKRAVFAVVTLDPCAICNQPFIVLDKERTEFPICPECSPCVTTIAVPITGRMVYAVDISNLPPQAGNQTIGEWKARLRTHGMEIDAAGDRNDD